MERYSSLLRDKKCISTGNIGSASLLIDVNCVHTRSAESDSLLTERNYVNAGTRSIDTLLSERTRSPSDDYVLTEVNYVPTGTRKSNVSLSERNSVSEQKRKTNLDKYFDDLYENEIQFQLDQDEVELIQTGVETLVKELVRVTRLERNDAIHIETEKFKESFRGLTDIDPDNLDASDGILKVGSFYEGTQSGFPNDFDFVFLLGSFRSDCITRSIVCYEDARYDVLYDIHCKDRDNCLHNAIRSVSSRIHSIYFMEDNRERMVADEDVLDLSQMEGFRSIVFDEYIIIDEKASKLRFIYQNELGKAMFINVQIIPAFRVYEEPQMRKSDDICSSPFVAIEVEQTGSVLVVSGLVWFAQSEVNFMQNTLSNRHIKAFMIVKYLVGGKVYTDCIYAKLIETGLWRYNTGIMSTYMIKACVISHHYACKHDEAAGEAPCILDILNNLKDVKSGEDVQLLTDVVHMPNFFRSDVRYDAIRDMIDSLQSYRQSRKPYQYETSTIIPINKTLLDCFGSNSDGRTKYEHAGMDRNSKGTSNECVSYCSVVINYVLIIALVVYVLVSFHVLTADFGEPYP